MARVRVTQHDGRKKQVQEPKEREGTGSKATEQSLTHTMLKAEVAKVSQRPGQGTITFDL